MRGEEHCAVCGRSILAGERLRGYLAGEERLTVCDLCVEGAERLGWRAEGEAEAAPPAALAAGRRGGFAGLLRRRRDAREAEPDPTPDSVPPDDPAAPGKRTAAPVPELSPLSPFERAAARFNASEAGHTVAGLARTLGAPWVSVGASAGAPNEVRITVAWELSWYQWGVDLGDELRPVFQIDKGLELAQLDSAARQWNASVIEGGRIALAAPAEGSPAGAPARN